MADTIKLVEQPVGSGKTFHVIRKIVEAGGLIIYCAPTKILARQVKKDIQKVISSNEFVHRKNTPLYIVTSEDKDYSTTVQEALTELILDADNSEAIIVCTLAGIQTVSGSVISKATNEIGKDVTLILDELPNLFSTYQHSFSGENVKVLDGLVTVEGDIARVNDSATYEHELHDKSFTSELQKLLELIPSGNVRFQKNKSNGWTVFGYELKENLSTVIKLSQTIYLLAATVKGTLDYVVLNDVWGFNLENCETVNSQVIKNKIKEKEGNIRVYPLLDESFSKGKANQGDYSSSMPNEDSCLVKMLDNAISFIEDSPALIVSNEWANRFVALRTKGKNNIELASPNVKGMNNHQDKHICCAIYTAKPNGFTTRSLNLLAEQYNLANLVGAFVLQSELDMIVQMCGRTSVRNRESNETCHFLVSDKKQAEHILETYVSDKQLYGSLMDESLMVNWSDFSDTNMGRPRSYEREETAQEMAQYMAYHDYIGEPIKQKDLAEMYGFTPSGVSKLLKDAGYKKPSKNDS
jgi:hypothetical protein